MAASLTPTEILRQRWGEAWLVTAKAGLFWAELEQFQQQLQITQPHYVLLAEPDPVRFLAALFAAVQHPCQVWLANPQWGRQEWQQVAAQCQPDLVVGVAPGTIGTREQPQNTKFSVHNWTNCQILIPTGGSSGNLRFATHTWDTLAASVWGFCEHFACTEVNAYCVLPLYHVSGLMQAMRCLLSGGQLVIQPFQELLRSGAIAAPAHNFFLSLVPTQLQRLLTATWDTVPWLRQFSAILLGGAPPWPGLLQTARSLALPLAPTYGMTETASQVVTLLPQEFLSGQAGCGRVLPHAALIIRDAEGKALPPHQVGQIFIVAESLALATGGTPLSQPFQTQDLGYLDDAGCLHVVGRAKTLIITGGEKVLPEEVEGAIQATELVQDVAVLGISDTDWGEKVVAVVVPSTQAAIDGAPGSRLGQQLRQTLQSQLSAYKIPKMWLVRSALPRNAQGKLNRAALRQWVEEQLSSTAATTGSAPMSADGAAG